MYVIQRQDDGKFVAPPGEHSYTSDLRKAITFREREHAERECCGNERVVSVDSLLPHSHPWLR